MKTNQSYFYEPARKKYLPGLSCLFFIVVMALSGCARKNLPASTTPITRKLQKNSSEYQAAVQSKQFLSACEILFTDGEMFDENSATYTELGKYYEISFNVINEETGKPGTYQKLVYSVDEKNVMVYFDEKNPSGAPVSKSTQKIQWPPKWWPSGGGSGGGGGGGGLGICFNWGNWTITNSFCDHRGGCIFRNQKALFVTEQRTCNTNPSNVQVRNKKVHCGC